MSISSLDCPTVERKTGGIWDYISPSRLNTWLRCPLAWKLRYIDGIRSPTSPAMFLGKTVHSGLEILNRHRQLCVELSPEDVATRMLAGWDEAVASESMRFESLQDEGALKKQAADLVAAYMEHTAGTLETPLAVETSMESPLIDPDTGEDLGIPLLGIVDLITNGRDGTSVVDFKTSARSSPPYEITHEIQLSSYAYLFRQATGDKEGGLEIRSLIKTKTPKVVIHAYPSRSDAHLRRLFAVTRVYLDDLDAGQFVYRPGFGCAMCDHRDTNCRTWMA